MPFEFDTAESARNRAKHGVDFVEAQAIWTDPDRIEVQGRSDVEPRWIVIGRIGEITWAACITYRDEEIIRIISVRRARQGERDEYERRQSARQDPG